MSKTNCTPLSTYICVCRIICYVCTLIYWTLKVVEVCRYIRLDKFHQVIYPIYIQVNTNTYGHFAADKEWITYTLYI